jgi:2-polyprenyl-3-methyl-5-hydroxy-6-metoxy-1,4-benzoquinol methylase
LAYIYEVPVDPEAENNPHSFLLDFVGHNKRVLEVGCANGYVTKVLRERGCTVVGIELDAEAATMAEKWAERVVVGDLDAGVLWQELEGEQFDAVTFGDVLEHLRDPLATLRAAMRCLKPSGIVAISVPNIAHGDVKIALLHGEFPYRDTGLLDRSHIRFFTKVGLRDMIKEAGLVVVETRRVVQPLFQTELAVERERVDQSTIDLVLSDPEAETYQFVVKAVPDDGTHAFADLADRASELSDRAHDEIARTALLEREIQQLREERDYSHQALHDARQQAFAYQQQFDAVLNTKSFRLLAPLRRQYGLVRRGSEQVAPAKKSGSARVRWATSSLLRSPAAGTRVSPPVAAAGELEETLRTGYLDLLKGCLTRLLFMNDGPGRDAEALAAKRQLREAGAGDWPDEGETMVGMFRLNNIQTCVTEVIRQGIPGDFLEAGVWRGGASIFMRALLFAFGEPDRNVWVADSFEGLPPPDPTKFAHDTIDLSPHSRLAVSLEEVQSNFARYGMLDERVHFLQGWFKDTLHTAPIERLAILRLDGDYYESTIQGLEALYDKVSPGGYVIIDDYFAMDPCRQAVSDFRAANAIHDEMIQIDWTGIYWQKSSS